MQYIDFAKARFDAAIHEIHRLKHSEFPYTHIRDALSQLAEVFERQRTKLDKLSAVSTPSISKNACKQSLSILFRYTPYLGFVVRATNVRNAFELYPPLMRIARRALGDKTKLLLSSEWSYSPFVYLPPVELADFVLIGVPAFESSNALLTALAGHELGHSIWKKHAIAAKFDAGLKAAVVDSIQNAFWSEFEAYCPSATKTNLNSDMFARQAWFPAHQFALLQLEEVFCDMMGLRLFGEAYLHAFAYLLAPGLPSEQSPNYPEISKRIEYLLTGAKKLGVEELVGYSDLFEPQPFPSNPVTKLLVQIAASAITGMIESVVTEAKTFADDNGLPERSVDEVNLIVKDFRKVIPSEGNTSLTNIINAGWKLFLDTTLWQDVPQMQKTERSRVLNDLVLKSCEVTEYAERLATP